MTGPTVKERGGFCKLFSPATEKAVVCESEKGALNMPRIAFEQLPEDARLWIFAAARELSDPERARLLEEVDGFIDQWMAHNVRLVAARDWRHDRFLFVGVDEAAAGISGCSVDALVRRMKLLQEELGVELVNHAPVLFRDGDAIQRVSRERFGELADTGAVSLNTSVFDNTLARVGDVRAGCWEVRAADSWHARAFFARASLL